jgi:hypothetical protein
MDDVLTRHANALGALGDRKGKVALARAVNRVTNTVYGRVAKDVSKRTSIPVTKVRRQMTKHLARPGYEMNGVIYSAGKPMPLKEFGARQFSYGVKLKIWGKVRRFEGMFIKAGSFRGGTDVGQGHVFQRQTTASLPIDVQTGPAVPEEMIKGSTKKVFEDTVRTMLPERVNHEIRRLLPSST